MLKDLWGEVLREEQQRHDLMLMFPDLQLSPGTTEPDRARSASPRSPKSRGLFPESRSRRRARILCECAGAKICRGERFSVQIE